VFHAAESKHQPGFRAMPINLKPTTLRGDHPIK
jgi:hypothetical protein